MCRLRAQRVGKALLVGSAVVGLIILGDGLKIYSQVKLYVKEIVIEAGLKIL